MSSTPQDALSGVERELEAARAGLNRVTPAEAWSMMQSGVLLVDTRTESQRAAGGEIPGAVVIDRTVLEWRLDPTCPSRSDVAPAADEPVVVVCSQGYSSSLAAASLQRVGLSAATDMIGGFERWRAEGLPVVDQPARASTTSTS